MNGKTISHLRAPFVSCQINRTDKSTLPPTGILPMTADWRSPLLIGFPAERGAARSPRKSPSCVPPHTPWEGKNMHWVAIVWACGILLVIYVVSWCPCVGRALLIPMWNVEAAVYPPGCVQHCQVAQVWCTELKLIFKKIVFQKADKYPNGKYFKNTS